MSLSRWKMVQGSLCHLTLVVGVVLIIPTQALTPDEITVFLSEADAFRTSGDFEIIDWYLKYLIGPLPALGKPDREGIYNRFMQAYHFNVYGSRLYDRGQTWVKYWGTVFTDVRRYQYYWKRFVDLIEMCIVKRDAYQLTRSPAEGKSYVESCSPLQKLMSTKKKEEFELNMKKALIYATYLVGSMLHVACVYDADFYRFNGFKSSDAVKLSLYGRMTEEYNKVSSEIDKYLPMLRDHVREVSRANSQSDYARLIKEKLGDIDTKLATPTFKTLYTRDIDERKEWMENFKKHESYYCKELHLALWNFGYVDEYYFILLVEADITELKPPLKERWEHLLEYGLLETIYNVSEQFLKVEPLSNDTAEIRNKDFVTWDGKWDWKINESWLHRIRLGTDLLDSVAEELKCYLNLTFTKEKRDKMIEDYIKSVDWGSTKLYIDISPTLMRPCATANDSDLVGTCTRENHEICIPMYYDPAVQDPLDEAKGGLSLMKPKWYFRKMSDGKCQGKRTYITHYKICQCGFRQDCGSDLPGSPQITCQLVENDLIRKQCRGSIAYPCKSHPLAPGQYHRSCATGFCDLDENSCERWHWHIFE